MLFLNLRNAYFYACLKKEYDRNCLNFEMLKKQQSIVLARTQKTVGGIQRKEKRGDKVEADGDVEEYVKNLDGGGEPLPETARQFFEPRFGHDFSNIRIHADANASASAQSVNALAYTAGNHIVFNKDQFSHGNAVGKRLLAHELAHV